MWQGSGDPVRQGQAVAVGAGAAQDGADVAVEEVLGPGRVAVLEGAGQGQVFGGVLGDLLAADEGGGGGRPGKKMKPAKKRKGFGEL